MRASMTNNLPTVTANGDVALDATGSGIVPALQSLVANLNHDAKAFDDINVSLHVESMADGASRSVFSYRAYKHKR